MTEVARPPEYASAILRREELCLLMVVRQTESRAGLWMGEFEARDYRACRRCRPLPDRARLLKRVSCSARKLAPEFQGAAADKPRPPAPRDRSATARPPAAPTDERRSGQECDRPCKSRLSTCHETKKKTKRAK